MKIIATVERQGAYGFPFRVSVGRTRHYHYLLIDGFGWGLHGDINSGGMMHRRTRISSAAAAEAAKMIGWADNDALPERMTLADIPALVIGT